MYERRVLGNYKSYSTGIMNADSKDSCAAKCLAHFNALKCISLVNTYRLTQKKFGTPTLTPITLKSVCLPNNHILRSRVDGALQSRFAACISPSPFGPFS